ncbi:MAG TPA: hypothetical protein VMF55_00240 [Solirubrobacterales bacterium]|nr:hypothetical protein [Solirubrobacterales bacterium]
MDELTLLQSFRAERDTDPAPARQAVWRALEARIEAAAEESRAFGERVAATGPRPAAVRRRRGLGTVRRRRLVAFAAAVLAVIVGGALVLESGPTAQPASAAEILHEAADAATAAGAPAALIPGPGQFYYRKEARLNVTGWTSPVPGPHADAPVETSGGTSDGPDDYNAIVPTTVTMWTATDGSGRVREEIGPLRFWSQAEEARWKKAGSPLPPPFNPEYQQLYKSAFRNATELGPEALDYKLDGFGSSFHFPDTSKLPTDPKALRQAVEANAIEVGGFNLLYPKATHLDVEQTAAELLNVLFEGTPTPRLQAAIFDALAELPGIEVTATTDSLGREGDAIAFGPEDGVRREYLFDPATSTLLAERGVLVDPAASRGYRKLPAGTAIGERDFLESGVVGSTAETAGEAAARAAAKPGSEAS